jgi:CRP-like cAMP-binding protein
MDARTGPLPVRELLLESLEQVEATFPKLDAGQIAQLAAFGWQLDAQAREVILQRGDLRHRIFVVLSGSLGVIRAAGDSETILHALVSAEFTGDVNLLSGRWNAGARQGAAFNLDRTLGHRV